MMDLCVSKFKESEGLYVGPKEAGYCLLRSQLLMAFHDNAAYRSLANEVSQPSTLNLLLICVTAAAYCSLANEVSQASTLNLLLI